MLVYLEKFNKLPAAVRNKVSDSRAMAIIEKLEKKYNVSLAALIMKVMVKEIALDDLTDHLLKENLSSEPTEQLAKELRENIFSLLGDYFSAGAVKPSAPAAKTRPMSQPKVKGASFFFSPDDEEEIQELAKKIGAIDSSAVPAALIDEKLQEIIGRVRINFGATDLADRFKQILRTYLRGIRDRLETKATLMKPFLSGGLSFDEDSAGKVMSLADKVVNPVKSPARTTPVRTTLSGWQSGRLRTDTVGFNKVNLKDNLAADQMDEPIKPGSKIGPSELGKTNLTQRPEIIRDAPYDFSQLAKKDDSSLKARQPLGTGQAAAAGLDLKPLDIGHELPAPAPKEKAVRPPVSGPTAGGVPPEPIEAAQMPLIKRRFEAENLSQSPKTRVEDVKYVPRVMGPLDEIKYMDLINFRRLDREPMKSVDKIKNKINLLEEESYGKKLEGIKYWRSCPLYKLYLEIGNLSISENKPIDVIIEERKMAGLDHLTDEEFKAIMDLNKSLRF